jgi:transcriptional regulator with PAS, ATPase and Fis domain
VKDVANDLELQHTFELLGFVTASRDMLPLLQRARRAAEASDVTVLLEGETGTGKQVLAQGIHNLDQKRKTFSFVTVHCSTISEGLAESELFGHQRGAFSGAVGERKGLFQAAHKGTILLDDVNDLPFSLQAKLLDVIQRGSVRPVGSDREVKIDVRVIAACNQPLEPMVREGRFRADLYHRLNVVKLSLPPLRQRRADLASLLLALARRHEKLYSPIAEIEPALVDFVAAQPFPGNVRELENAVQRMLFHKTRGETLGLDDWVAQSGQEPQPSGGEYGRDILGEAAGAVWRAISQTGMSYEAALQEIEKRVLETAIASTGCTRREIAQRLRTSERTLYYKMRAHGLGRSGGAADPDAAVSANFCS